MDVVLRARGGRVTDQIRRTAEHKLSKLSRQDPRIVRCEVELIEEGSPRVGGGHRVQVSCQLPRRTFRAEASGRDVESALDQVIDHLERQLSAHKGKRRHRWARRWTRRTDRLESPRTSSDEAGRTE